MVKPNKSFEIKVNIFSFFVNNCYYIRNYFDWFTDSDYCDYYRRKYFRKFNFLKEVNIILGNPSKTELAFITISIFTAVYIFKSMFLIYNTYAQGKFIYTTNEHITKLLFKKYITEDLNFFINFNTHQMVERIKTDIAHCMNSLNSFLSILSELFIIIGITSFSFFI